MNVCWCDTETTGLNPSVHGVHEIGIIVVIDKKVIAKRLFRLNPEQSEYDVGSEVAHGKTEAEIRAYPPESEIVPNFIEVLEDAVNKGGEKLVFAGYNCPFDYGFIKALLARNGSSVDKYFSGKFIDVLELVRRGTREGKLPKTTDQKLGTMCKSLGVDLENAHTADADIQATRDLAIMLHRMGVKA